MTSLSRRRENAVAREAGWRLAAARDAEVIVQALDGLAERYAGQLPDSTIATIRNYLNEQRQ
jgi:hypothetical protein